MALFRPFVAFAAVLMLLELQSIVAVVSKCSLYFCRAGHDSSSCRQLLQLQSLLTLLLSVTGGLSVHTAEQTRPVCRGHHPGERAAVVSSLSLL